MRLLNASSALMLAEFKVAFTYFVRTNIKSSDTGYFTTFDTTKIPASGSIQPVDREELHALIQTIRGGDAIRDAIIIFTTAPLNTGEIGSPSKSGAFVQHGGFDWQVVEIENYGINGHVEAIAVRTDEVVVYTPANPLVTPAENFVVTGEQIVRTLDLTNPDGVSTADVANLLATLINDLKAGNSVQLLATYSVQGTASVRTLDLTDPTTVSAADVANLLATLINDLKAQA